MTTTKIHCPFFRGKSRAIVYVNGREVFRSHMPNGPIFYNTLASGTVGNADENTFYPTNVSPTNFVLGTNLIAAEIHQVATNSTDISFDLELFGLRSPTWPRLDARLDTSGLELKWTALATAFRLESSQALTLLSWNAFPATPTLTNNEYSVIVTNPLSPSFFRLHRP
jgi:hypothetical protein